MTEKGLRILVIDDEPQIRKLLNVSLQAYGYQLSEAANGLGGIQQAAVFKPDLAIVDLGLPDMDGKEVIRQIRDWSAMPIIILTARDQEQEKIAALDAGADDYITKPFGIGELMARMRVCLRRIAASDNEPILHCGGLAVDLLQRRVTVDDREIKLTPTEYELIKFMIQHAGRVLTHKQLLKAGWGNSYGEDTHYIRIYIGQLRRKIEQDPTQPRYIVTESGIGYRLMGR
ncbi:MAG TPA: response regulator [Methylomusa anaerophila]|uniref:Transcriptional regulatory protein KdpE n=1 Tax=Methylomusa anaerophila TaxID=1930071 RepID=A0A348AIJ2_9FIRM|nr:response regulator [Methylomusa anaerophila]BBB90890.1 KDP operon transcriptional regulatory protein KdpE [Methylomusa anaerophila]HML90609.1 response regulator [Methylomusa anaerophila]